MARKESKEGRKKEICYSSCVTNRRLTVQKRNREREREREREVNCTEEKQRTRERERERQTNVIVY